MRKVAVLITVISLFMLIVSCEKDEEENIYGEVGDTSTDKPDKDADIIQVKPDKDTLVINDDSIDDSDVIDVDEVADEEIDITKGMILVPQGLAWVGCNENIQTDCPATELPYHQISAKSFYIDKFEVTVADFERCLQDKACGQEGSAYDTLTGNPYCNLGAGKDNHPMNCVSYFGAAAYCEWAGKRLPSEGEWEKAARGGCEIHGEDDCEEKSYIYTWGNEGTPDCSNVSMATKDGPNIDYGCGTDSTALVGSFEAGKSPYGTYDMLGNVFEWVADEWNDNHEGANPDGSSRGVADGEGVVKGGGFMQTNVFEFRISYRARIYTEEILYSRGFRCVADIPQ